MYPHERSLVERYQDKPFVFLGINSDADREVMKRIMSRQHLNWRCWWDGGGPGGPIASRYHVEAWPALYVLDAEGVIRYAQVRGAALEQAVETLVREAEKTKNRK